MIQFEKLNKLFGVRKASDFLNPRVINDEEFILPYNSAIIEYDHEYVGDALYNRTPKRTYVYIEDKYIIDGVGKFKKLEITKSSTIMNLKKLDTVKEFKFVLSKEKLWSVQPNTLILIDAYRVKKLYKYRDTRTSILDEHNNRLKNAIAHTVDPDKLTNRRIYMTINIPKEIPTLSELKKMNKMKGYRVLAKYNEPNILTLLELTRLIAREESLFDVIVDKNNTDLVFLFTIHGKITMVEMKSLLALNNEYGVDSKIKGFTPNKAVKVFLRYLLEISLKAPKSLALLESDTITDVGLKKDDTEGSDSDIELMIERHNELNSVKEIKDTPKVTTESDIEIIEKVETKKDKLSRAVSDRVDSGIMSESIAKKILSIEDESTVVKIEELHINKRKYPDNIFVVDKEMLSATIEDFDKVYIDKVYKKHQNNVIVAGGGSHVVHGHTVETKEDIMNSVETHSFKILQPNGKTITRRMIIPVVDKEGYMKLNGNRYRMRKQKGDIPVRKISPTQVALSSYYSKLFIRKAETNKNNSCVSILKQLKDRLGSDISMLLIADITIISENVPHSYSTIARKIKSFTIDGIYCSFDYNNRSSLGEDKGGVIFAKSKRNTYTVNKKNKVTDQNGKVYGTLFEFLKLDESSIKPDYANIYILGNRIPLVLVLIYYIGFESLLQTVKTSAKKIDSDYEIKDSDSIITFKDGKYVFSGGVYKDVLFGALENMKELKQIDFVELNYRSGLLDLFFSLGFSSKLPRELENLDSMWIDPITMDVLKQLKLPTTWKGILLHSALLLVTNNSKDQNDMRGIRIKGYERINGIVYNLMAKAIRDNEHRVGNVQSKFELNPYSLLAALSEESTFMMEDDLNPIAHMKTKEDITLTGKFGRNKEAISIKDRVFHSSNIGIVSESTKDSGDVGVTSYLSSSPMIDDLLGLVNVEQLMSADLETSNIFSTSAVMAPASLNDDGKRMMAITTQNSHKIPTKNSIVLPIRTGFETAMPYRMDSKFIGFADRKGKVTKVNNSIVEITYSDKEVKKYRLNSWVTKEINGSAFTHHSVTELLLGDVVNEYDVIYYDKLYFEVDMFDKKRVLYKNGEMAMVAFDESQEDHEDAGTMTEDFAKSYTTDVTKVRSIVIDKDSIIFDIKRVGDTIGYNDTLYTSTSDIEGDDVDMTERAKELISEMANSSPKSKIKGKIIGISVYYTCDKKEMSDTLAELVTASDKELKKNTGFTGKVDGSYTIKGNVLLENELEIKFYIESTQGTQIGDKAVLSNQLKFTVSKLADKITDEDGRDVDAKFGFRGLGARIVDSPIIIGTTALLLKSLDKEIVDIYFK